MGAHFKIDKVRKAAMAARLNSQFRLEHVSPKETFSSRKEVVSDKLIRDFEWQVSNAELKSC